MNFIKFQRENNNYVKFNEDLKENHLGMYMKINS